MEFLLGLILFKRNILCYETNMNFCRFLFLRAYCFLYGRAKFSVNITTVVVS